MDRFLKDVMAIRDSEQIEEHVNKPPVAGTHAVTPNGQLIGRKSKQDKGEVRFDDLKKKFNQKCKELGVSPNSILNELMKVWLNQQ